MDRQTPASWDWAYHVAAEDLLGSISREGLQPNWHSSVLEAPVIFVEPDPDGIEPYYHEGTVVLRFKTPGFGSTEDGELVIYGGARRPGDPPDAPLVGEPGSNGAIPPERLQILRNRKFDWLV